MNPTGAVADERDRLAIWRDEDSGVASGRRPPALITVAPQRPRKLATAHRLDLARFAVRRQLLIDEHPISAPLEIADVTDRRYPCDVAALCRDDSETPLDRHVLERAHHRAVPAQLFGLEAATGRAERQPPAD